MVLVSVNWEKKIGGDADGEGGAWSFVVRAGETDVLCTSGSQASGRGVRGLGVPLSIRYVR